MLKRIFLSPELSLVTLWTAVPLIHFSSPFGKGSPNVRQSQKAFYTHKCTENGSGNLPALALDTYRLPAQSPSIGRLFAGSVELHRVFRQVSFTWINTVSALGIHRAHKTKTGGEVIFFSSSRGSLWPWASERSREPSDSANHFLRNTFMCSIVISWWFCLMESH